jgi:hypothetical protein
MSEAKRTPTKRGPRISNWIKRKNGDWHIHPWHKKTLFTPVPSDLYSNAMWFVSGFIPLATNGTKILHDLVALFLVDKRSANILPTILRKSYLDLMEGTYELEDQLIMHRYWFIEVDNHIHLMTLMINQYQKCGNEERSLPSLIDNLLIQSIVTRQLMECLKKAFEHKINRLENLEDNTEKILKKLSRIQVYQKLKFSNQEDQ